MKDTKTQTFSVIPCSKMNRLSIFKISFVVIFFTAGFQIKAQDLRDFEHTIKFADYLFKTQQYTLAAEEYERAVYYDSTNNSALLRLLQCYRYAGKNDIVAARFTYFFKDSLNYLRRDFAEEYVKNLLLRNEFETAYGYLDKNINIDETERESMQLGCLLLQKKWDNAFDYALKHPVTGDKKNADIHVVAFRSKQLKYKKPFVAATFSTLIPGTGKMYTKNWKDGIISLLFVGVNGWQAYRGFNKYGSNSVYGWVFTGFAASFYIGNIFGSYKSAKKYNEKLDNQIYQEARHLMVGGM